MSRYQIIVGMLEDPLNLACVLREIMRLQMNAEIKILPPPIVTTNGRHIYPTFRGFLRIKKFSTVKNFESIDYLIDIFSTGDGIWYIAQQDATEIGPFDSLIKAKEEMVRLMTEEGYTVLEKCPWDDKDSFSYPI